MATLNALPIRHGVWPEWYDAPAQSDMLLVGEREGFLIGETKDQTNTFHLPTLGAFELPRFSVHCAET